MILIFGSTGYMGSAIVQECIKRGIKVQSGQRARFGDVVDQIRQCQASLVINSAAFIPNPTVDACKDHPEETICGNVLWPQLLARACDNFDIPIMHLSTGCLFDEQREYSEEHIPTRGWDGYCGFYVGTKLLAEKLVREYPKHYILRLRLPFDEIDHPRNYLTKLTKFERVFDHVNSLTHRGDFAKWVLDLWDKNAWFGTYHCVNTGQIGARDIVHLMRLKGLIDHEPTIENSPGTTGARLSTAKLAAEIGKPRLVHDAVADAVQNWRKADV